jgi:Flp pilus assembly secretin CpaC
VTPTIHEDDFITMKIKPEVSSVTSNLTTSNNNTIPIVETSEAETTVNVKDGVSVIIGGLIKEETINTTKKVPFLGSIPVLGMVFRNTSNSTAKTEIVIFLTPQIGTGDLGDLDRLAVCKGNKEEHPSFNGVVFRNILFFSTSSIIDGLSEKKNSGLYQKLLKMNMI